MHVVWFLIFHCVLTAWAERCPIWSSVECPVGWGCIEGQCRQKIGCSDIICPAGTKCEEGQCIRLSDLRCDRNVVVTSDQSRARSISTDCGVDGVCISGRCKTDRCKPRTCPEGHRCLDGNCEKIIDKFCITSFECGIGYSCTSNKCVLLPSDGQELCNCDPGFTCKQGQCRRDSGCEFLTCSKETKCLRGRCVQVEGRKCSSTLADCGKGFLCRNGRCAVDACLLIQCGAATVCFEGECRLADGMVCTIGQPNCPTGYKCFDGRCTKDDCMGKICPAGHACEGGWCQQIQGRLCSSGLRDCAESFQCVQGQCVDKFEDAFIAI